MNTLTPVYILTGFLGSGKTTFLSHILSSYEKKKVLLLQFEEGEEEPEISAPEIFLVRQLTWSKEKLENDFETLRKEFTLEIESEDYDEIWIEWNGMELFSRLERLLLQRELALFLHIEKVIYLADVPEADLLLGQTGEAPVSQIAASDLIFLRNAGKAKMRASFIRKLQSIAPSVKIYPCTQKNIRRELRKKSENPFLLWIFLALMTGFVLSIVPLSDRFSFPIMKTCTLFMGVFLQAIPFLILGVLLSSAIQVLVPRKWITRFFPERTIPAMLTGILSGFFLPVCDCASIPVFKSLLNKGIPLPAAVCFMTASPVINPVVILSTYYAYNCSIKAVLLRCGTGMLCSFLIGLSFLIRKPEDFFRSSLEVGNFCTCGCYLSIEDSKSFSGKFQQFCRHAQAEFYSVARYLLGGIAISVLFQQLNLTWLGSAGNASLFSSVFFMMLLAFLLSLCSSSDAVVARSLSGTANFLPALGFLVFGPMMDIKNIVLLHSYFKKNFILRLAVTIAVVCYTVVMILGIFIGDVTI